MKYVGLMSGTSCDGVDAALLEVEGRTPDAVSATLRGFQVLPYPDAVRERLLAAVTRGGPAELAWLHLAVARASAEAVMGLLDGAGVDARDIAAVGSHGHTVWHAPPGSVEGAEGASRGVSLQLGDPATLAAATGIAVVSDLRSADLAAGGHGAPLVPFADRLLFTHPTEARILLNIGGMANLTWLPPRGADTAPLAFDTGPGNALLDLAAAAATGGRLRCDEDGALARAGTVDPALLAELAGDPWFRTPPPRSTGRERFGATMLADILSGGDGAPGPDHLATLTALTATTVADAVARWVLPRAVDRIVVTGGGAHNPALVEALSTALGEAGVDAPLATGAAALGMDPDAREAAAFALLAWAHLHDVAGNVPSCTAASGPRVLGSLTPAPASDTGAGGGIPGRAGHG